MEKTDFIHILKSEEQQDAARRLLNLLDLFEKTGRRAFSDFVDPAVRKVMTPYIRRRLGDGYRFYGGFDEAERSVLCVFGPGDEPMDWDWPFVRINIKNNSFSPFRHRDVLGSVLSLGLRREKIGDIIVDEEQADLYAAAELSDFIIANLDQIKRGGAKPRVADTLTPDAKPEQGRQVTTSVSSLRLDAVIAHGFGIARSDAKALVESGRVKVDHLETDKPDLPVEEGIWLSVRGYGRLKIEKILGLSKKGGVKLSLRRLS